jgi:MAternally-affected-uncoordination protein
VQLYFLIDNIPFVIRLMKRKQQAGAGPLVLSQEETDVLDRLVSLESVPAHCHGLRAATLYVRGLHAFLTGRYNEAKSFLRDTLKMANAEDLNRLTSISLVLLGQIFLALRNSRESMNMVTPAMQLASKIPDHSIQLWAASIQRSTLFLNC